MGRPDDALGDPDSEMCRWCNGAKRHIRGHLFCTRCDSAGNGINIVILSTWDRP